MKVSFLCANAYAGPRAQASGSFPYPPALFDPEIGARSVEAALAQAQLADELGFDWVSVSEHHYAPRLLTPNAMAFAGALTQVVRRARIAVLGPIVSINNPVRIAEEIGLLDLLSGGRLVVFLLRGTPDEFQTYFVNPHETRERAHEAITLIRHALTEPRPFGWEGRYFRFPTIAVWPQPTQRPHPPIFSSGNSPESTVFSARERYGLAMSFMPPPVVAQAVAMYRAECAKHGWQPSADQIVYRAFVAVGETDDEAEAVRSRFGRGITRDGANAGAPRGLGAISWWEYAQAAGKTPRDAATITVDGDAKGGEGFGLGSLQFCGGPESLVEQIRAFHELTGVGVLDLIFVPAGGAAGLERAMRLFAAEVLPRVHAIGATATTAPEKGMVGVAD